MIGFGIIGGDRRQLYLARSLAEDGHLVLVNGMERAQDTAGLKMAQLPDLAERCEVILLPLPVTREGAALNAPFAGQAIPLDRLETALAGHRVFGGMLGALGEGSPFWQSCRDYYAQEELLTGNAWLTAEGAVALAVTQYPGTLGGASCLVAGYGRIGKALCPMLRGMGAQVFCAARRPEALAAVRALGCVPLGYDQLQRPFDLIFNTVPVPVLGSAVLVRQKQDTLLMELASAPGGFDRAAAERLGLSILDSPSLPGRTSPKAAGELIKTTIYHMLEADQAGKPLSRP